MKLRRKKDGAYHQNENTCSALGNLHLITKTELRKEWLRGQAFKPFRCVTYHRGSGIYARGPAKEACFRPETSPNCVAFESSMATDLLALPSNVLG
jgi:hypothetical protein